MAQTICPYCGKIFQRSSYHPNQKICSDAACQRRRRAVYHRKKIAVDPEYSDTCRRSQEKWREAHRGYSTEHRAQRRNRPRATEDKARLMRKLRRLIDDAKNNVAFDLTSSAASIWLITREPLPPGKNTFARADVIVLEGAIHAAAFAET
jgi:hypothetical protein